jgi:predicted RNA-binding protein
MCELTVYILKGGAREKAMEGVVKIMAHNGKVLLEGIFGDSMEIEGRLADVDIMAQAANIIVAT